MRTSTPRAAAAILTLLTGTLASLPAAADLAAALASPGRPEADQARDAGRQPEAVVAFLGIAPGMTVMDVIAAGGYYTEVLAGAVGPEGVVYAQNSPFVLKLRDGANDKALSSRLAGDRLPQVVRLDVEVAQLPLPADSVDVAMTALNFHDVYNGRGPEATASFLTAIRRVLKPGGVLGIIDHVGDADADNEKLHRIEPSLVESAALAAGFEIVGRSDLLRNPDDDHTRNVFAEGLRGHTDRFLLRLRKPE